MAVAPGADLIEVPHAPHAPHAPSAEEILGPPPKPPRIGSKGGAGRLRFKRGGYHPGRPPSPTRAAEHAREQQQARTAQAQAKTPQKVTVDVKTARPETPRPAGARGPQYNARQSLQRKRVQRAQQAAQLARAAHQRNGGDGDNLTRQQESARAARENLKAKAAAPDASASADAQAEQEAQMFANDPLTKKTMGGASEGGDAS